MSLYEQEPIEYFLENKFNNMIIELSRNLIYVKKMINECYTDKQLKPGKLLRINQSFENTIIYLKEMIDEGDFLEF